MHAIANTVTKKQCERDVFIIVGHSERFLSVAIRVPLINLVPLQEIIGERRHSGSVEVSGPISLATLHTVLKCAFSYEEDVIEVGYECV